MELGNKIMEEKTSRKHPKQPIKLIKLKENYIGRHNLKEVANIKNTLLKR